MSDPKPNPMMEAIGLIRAQHERDKKHRGIIPCPKCAGDLAYTVSSYNGHIWGKCAKPGCLAWMM